MVTVVEYWEKGGETSYARGSGTKIQIGGLSTSLTLAEDAGVDVSEGSPRHPPTAPPHELERVK